MARWLLAGAAVLGWAASAPAQEGLWEVYHDAGVRAQMRGFAADAEKLLKTALEAADKAGPSFLGPVQSLDALAALYAEQNRRPEAEAQLQRALAVTEKALGAESLAAAARCEKLGAFLMQDERDGPVRAEPHYRRALGLYGKEPGLDAVSGSGMALFTCYLFQDKLTEAEQTARWCLAVASRRPGPDAARAQAVCQRCLGEVHYRRRQDAEAEEAYRRGLQIAEREFGPDDVSLLWILYRFGDLQWLGLGRAAQAEPLYRRALAIADKGGPAYQGNATEFRVSLAAVCNAQGKTAEALALAERFRADVDQLPPMSRPGDKMNLALLLARAARLHADLGRQADADALGKRALDLMEQTPDGPFRNLGGVCRDLADVRLAQNKPAEAEAQAKRALEADRKHYGDRDEAGVLGADLVRLARLARLRGQDAEAERLAREAVAAGERARGMARTDLRAIFDEYQTLLQKLGRADEARKLEARAAELKLPPKAR
jgi:tetratricopeptide (TPR) repeat protein